MLFSYFIFVGLLSLATILPLSKNQHWVFRVSEMARIQVAVLQLVIFLLAFAVIEIDNAVFICTQLILFCLVFYNGWVLLPFTSLYNRIEPEHFRKDSRSISIISVNVLQSNTNYQKLIELIEQLKPEMLLTIESNNDWENALSAIETEYTHTIKIPQQNTYGMHLFSKLPFRDFKVNYFVADDIPSIEAEIQISYKKHFKLYGIHPPPPSPTEEKNSKERDGDLLSIAKAVQNERLPVVVIGDFNNVAWAKSSKLFKKTSKLIDPRVGRGLLSTYHADYKLFQFPIDLTYHSKEIFIEEFRTLESIGSDHLPLYCKFFINNYNNIQQDQIEELEPGDEEIVEELIEEGKKETTKTRHPQ